jgi:hypothetical protein
MIADYINGVLYELENGETSKQTSSKEDWEDSAITFTARISGKRLGLARSESRVYKCTN